VLGPWWETGDITFTFSCVLSTGYLLYAVLEHKVLQDIPMGAGCLCDEAAMLRVMMQATSV
jgi:hypothetical protein